MESLNPCSNGMPSDRINLQNRFNKKSLNPCSNGMPSDMETRQRKSSRTCLNPCSNGMPSDPLGAPNWIESERS